MECGVRLFDFKQKEVINISDGARLGFVSDVEIDIKGGKLLKIIVAAPGRIFGIFGCEKEYVICWENIKKIGDDIILVDVCDNFLHDKKEKRF